MRQEHPRRLDVDVDSFLANLSRLQLGVAFPVATAQIEDLDVLIDLRRLFPSLTDRPVLLAS